MAVTKIQPTGVNSEASFTFANVTATGNVLTSNLSVSGNLALSGPNINLGPVANVKITGGTNGYVLKTDGTGNLDWVAQSGGGGGGTPGGSDTQVQFNDGSSFGGSANFTFNKTTNVLSVNGNVIAGNANLGNLATANFFSGSGNLLSNIQGANVSGAVAYATTANSVAGSNVSGEVTYAATANAVAGSNVTGAVAYATTANSVAGANVTGEVSYAATANSVAGANVSGAVAYATTANSVAGSNVSGEVSYAATANAVSGSNVSGQVGNALIAGTVYTNAQPNITSVGTLTSLSVTGNVTGGNISATGKVYASDFINGGTGIYLAAGPSGYINFFTSTGDRVTITDAGNISAVGNAIASYFIGNGSALSSLTGANVTGEVSYAATANAVAGGNVSGQVANALIAGTVYTNAQPNITSVGTLTSLSVSGNALVNGNLIVDGTTTYVNTTNLLVQDPIIEQGGGANGAALTTNDGKDRGIVLHYYSGSTIDAFMGWDNSNAEFSFGSNVSMSGEVATFNTLGNIRSGNASLGNLVTASFFSGSGNLLSNIQGSNVSGEVAFAATANSVAGGNVSGTVSSATTATTAGTVTTAAQPNITSVGTLAALTVGPNSSIVLSGTTGYVKANSLQGLDGSQALFIGHSGVAGAIGVVTNLIVGTGGTGNLTANGTISASGNVTGNYFIGNGSQLTNLIATTVTTNAQPNITSTGTLVSLSVTGNANVGNLSTAGNVTGSYILGNGSQLTSVTAVSATTAGTVTTNAQPNITSVGILTSLSVSGNVTAGNLKTDNLLYANGTAYSIGGGGGTPGGSNTFIQFNDADSFGGNSALTYDKTSNRISITNYSVVTNAIGNATGSKTINLNIGTYITATSTGTTTWTFSNPATSGNASGFVLELTNGGAYTQIWPASVKWPSGSAPTLTSSGVDILVFITDDGGTAWRGVASIIDSK
jgi:hypothetical protein